MWSRRPPPSSSRSSRVTAIAAHGADLEVEDHRGPGSAPRTAAAHGVARCSLPDRVSGHPSTERTSSRTVFESVAMRTSRVASGFDGYPRMGTTLQTLRFSGAIVP